MAGSVSYTTTDQELVAAFRANLVRNFVSPSSVARLALFIGILALGAFALNIQGTQSFDDSVRAAAMVALWALGGGLAVNLLSYLGVGGRVRKLFAQQRGLREASDASWTDDGLEIRNAISTVAMPWPDYYAWQASAHGFLLYISDYYLFLLPRRAFSDDQWSDFERTITASGLRRRGGPATAARPSAPRARSALPTGWPLTRWLTQSPPPRPGLVALLWMIVTALDIFAYVLFRDAYDTQSVLYLSGALVLGGLLAGWALRLRAGTLGLVEALLQINIAYQILLIAITFCLMPNHDAAWLAWLSLIPAIVSVAVIWRRYRRQSAGRRLAATFLLFLSLALSRTFYQAADRWFAGISMQARAAWHLAPPPDPDAEAMAKLRDIPADTLWGAQRGLTKKAVAGLSTRNPALSNVYAMAVAGDGTERLFTREARVALRIAAARFGDRYHGGMLLSNDADEVLKTPFATRDNIAAAFQGIAGRIDPARDIAFLYLVSHGSRDAELTTDTASYDQLKPISAAWVDDALARAGVKRRVIIISACFAGSWIPTLANDDTIVIAAARKDRTSFGCDDSLRLTYFGHAFLEGPLARGASLHEAFEAAKAAVTHLERADRATPSEPQAYVGRNMRALWDERRDQGR